MGLSIDLTALLRLLDLKLAIKTLICFFFPNQNANYFLDGIIIQSYENTKEPDLVFE